MRSSDNPKILKNFSDRLSLLYSNWSKNLSRGWMDAKLIVVCTPAEPRYYDGVPDIDSCKFFTWLFGEWSSHTYVIISPTKLYVVCLDSFMKGIYDAEYFDPFVAEAKKTLGVDLVVKVKKNCRTLREAIEMMMGGESGGSAGVKKKGKVAVGYIREEEPAEELSKWMEWVDVTDAFYKLAGSKNCT